MRDLEPADAPPDPRILAGRQANEDAVVLRFPPGMALVQTVDFFTPIVNDPYKFGQIAATNALSDVYAMGGEPYAAMNILCFPLKTLPKSMLREILAGGLDKVREAGAVLAGGHSIEDEELKYGLAVSGVIDPECIASNKGLRPGDQLLLTKPLGTGVLATALKADWSGSAHFEALIHHWGARLNKVGGAVIRSLRLRAATDITGFGLGGHLLEMLQGSGVRAELQASRVPFIPEALELAGLGLLPAGSHANRNWCEKLFRAAPQVPTVQSDLVFDAQTSGGLLLAVPADKLAQARTMLEDGGDLAAHVGEVLPLDPAHAVLELR